MKHLAFENDKKILLAKKRPPTRSEEVKELLTGMLKNDESTRYSWDDVFISKAVNKYRILNKQDT